MAPPSSKERRTNECAGVLFQYPIRGGVFSIYLCSTVYRLLILDHMACTAPPLSQVLGHQSQQDIIRVQEDGCPQQASK